ncbi:hypothetical protein LAD64_24220 [Klebsiella pneumoniae]|nr:hypothetical protein [Klebsiella pneumoniae]
MLGYKERSPGLRFNDPQKAKALLKQAGLEQGAVEVTVGLGGLTESISFKQGTGSAVRSNAEILQGAIIGKPNFRIEQKNELNMKRLSFHQRRDRKSSFVRWSRMFPAWRDDVR